MCNFARGHLASGWYVHRPKWSYGLRSLGVLWRWNKTPYYFNDRPEVKI